MLLGVAAAAAAAAAATQTPSGWVCSVDRVEGCFVDQGQKVGGRLLQKHVRLY